MRTLDLATLRSFVAVADTGGVTRAAHLLNLTQSAVSMQMRRLEDVLGQPLLEKAGRGIALTPAGEQLLGFARRMLALNDEALHRLTDSAYEGQLALGVPHDIVYPHIPAILKRFHAEFPRMRVNMVSSWTKRLLEEFERGEIDLTLTTENGCGERGETLGEMPLVWIGAEDGAAWRSRPLRLAFEPYCQFRPAVQRALDEAGIGWEMAVDSESSRTIEASVSADLAVFAQLRGTAAPHLVEIDHGGALPELPSKRINLYTAPKREAGPDLPRDRLRDLLRSAYRGREAPALVA